MGTLPLPKWHLWQILKQEEDAEYKIKLEDKETEADAQRSAYKLIHRIRVELSRARDKLRAKGRIPRQFKLLVRSVEYNKDEKSITITLVRSQNMTETISSQMHDIFDALDGGPQ